MIEFETFERSVGDTSYRLCLRLPEMGRPKIAFQILRTTGEKEVWHTIPRSWRNLYADARHIFEDELGIYKVG